MTVGSAIAIAGARLVSGSSEGTIQGVADSQSRDIAGLALFCTDAERYETLRGRAFGLCFVTEKILSAVNLSGGAVAVSTSPRLAFAKFCDHFVSEVSVKNFTKKFHDTITVNETTRVSSDAIIGHGTTIGPHVYIGPGVEIGAGAIIGAGVTISHALIGDNVRILSGARIGQAGFGFEQSETGLQRVPQLGRVIIGDNVEIGANTTIDRGALGDTEIGNGVKIDNLVQIGHNVKLGDYCVLAAQTGISGSCVVGEGVFMGGQVGLADHLTIGDGAQIAAGSGLMRDVPPGGRWGGAPARPVREWLKETATLSKLAKKKSDKR